MQLYREFNDGRDCRNYCYFADNSRLGHRLSGDNRLSLEIILQAKKSGMNHRLHFLLIILNQIVKMMNESFSPFREHQK